MTKAGETLRDRDPEQIRADMEQARRQIASSVTSLRQQFRMTTDWREWVRRRPVLVVAGAFAVGFLVGRRR